MTTVKCKYTVFHKKSDREVACHKPSRCLRRAPRLTLQIYKQFFNKLYIHLKKRKKMIELELKILDDKIMVKNPPLSESEETAHKKQIGILVCEN